MTIDIRAALEGLVDAVKYGHTSELIAAMKAARLALAAEPVPPADGEVAGLVAWLHGQDGGIDRRATYSRIADLLSRLAPQPVPEGPSDEEIMGLMPQQMHEDLAHAARAMAGFDSPKAAMGAIRNILNRHAVDHARAVLDRWGHAPNA